MLSTTPQFCLSDHAQVRVLERTSLSEAQLLDHLQTNTCLWLKVPSWNNRRYALLFCTVTSIYVVAVVSPEGAVVTVLGLEMFEDAHFPVSENVRLLARVAMAKGLQKRERAAAQALVPIVPKRGHEDETYWLEVCMSVATAVPAKSEGRKGPAKACVNVSLGRWSCETLADAGIVIPHADASPDSRNALLQTSVARLMAVPEFARWLVQRLQENSDQLDRVCRFLVGLGTDERPKAERWFETTSQFRELLSLPA